MPGALSPYPLVVLEGARGQGGGEVGEGASSPAAWVVDCLRFGEAGGLAQAGQMFRATDPKPALGLLLLLEVQNTTLDHFSSLQQNLWSSKFVL